MKLRIIRDFSESFSEFQKQLDKILAKYHTMGEEVDKIYVQLKGYESEIKQSNKKLDTMFKTNVDYYHELVKYILAGEQACKEIEATLPRDSRIWRIREISLFSLNLPV